MKILIKGESACFTDPHTMPERYSYAVPTYSAIESLIKNVYWKPQITYNINSIQVHNEINHESVRRHSLTEKPSLAKSLGVIVKGGDEPYGKSRDDAHTLINTSYLKDVKYTVDFDYEINWEEVREDPKCKLEGKYSAQINRRLENGQYWKPPFLGLLHCRAWVGFPTGNEEIHESLKGRRSLGRMLYKMNWIEDKKGKLSWNKNGKIVKGFVEPEFRELEMIDGKIIF